MFKYNEVWYKRCCKCFIILCFVKCDKSGNKIKEKDVMDYIANSHKEIDLDQMVHAESPGETETL